MDEEKLKKAADLLKDASDVLLSVRNNSNSDTTSPTIERLSMTFTADGKRQRLPLFFDSFLVILK